MTVRYQEVKTAGKILNIYDNPDSWFWIHASINPYRGCEHNCVYCDGKAEYYRINQFSSLIRVKTDAHRKFEKELLGYGYATYKHPSLDNYLQTPRNEKNTKPGRIISLFAIGGGVCDVYQPAENTFNITRKILEVVHSFGIPISILTKNSLVKRDLSLIKKINEQSYANVCFSIALKDEKERAIFEPKSSSIYNRFETLKLMRKNHVHGGVMLMPIIPGIGDREENLRSIIKQSKENNAEFIIGGGLTLKPGKNKQEMLNTLQKHHPDLLTLYSELYGNNNKYGSPDISSRNFRNNIKIVHELCQRYKISDKIPRYLPSYVIKKNYLISTILHNLAYYYQYINEYPWKKIK